jgi:DNA-binding transcriptional ArsR family regulator
MLMEVVRWLRESGLDVEQQQVEATAGEGADAVLVVAGVGDRARFAVQMRRRAPYPNELADLSKLRESASRMGEPLLVARFVTEPLGAALTAQGWSWADAHGNFDLRAPGLLFRQRRAAKAPRPAPKTLPAGSGSFAVIRALIKFGDREEEHASATALAAQARISQPRASQVLGQLLAQNLVDKMADGRWRPRRQELLDRFLEEYRGPEGSVQYFYSLDSPTDVAVRAGNLLRHRVAVSADVGPDLISPFRRPTKVILYVKHLIDAHLLGLAQAQGRDDANVIVSMPADRSVFPVPELTAEVRGFEIGLADPSQMIWDLDYLGGSDRAEAAGELRTWLLARQ